VLNLNILVWVQFEHSLQHLGEEIVKTVPLARQNLHEVHHPCRRTAMDVTDACYTSEKNKPVLREVDRTHEQFPHHPKDEIVCKRTGA